MSRHGVDNRRRELLRRLAAAAVFTRATAGDARVPSAITPGSPRHPGQPDTVAPFSCLPVYVARPDERPALARRYPVLAYRSDNPAVLQIANILATDCPPGDPEGGHVGAPGESLFPLSGGRYLLPWASLFPKPTRILAAAPELAEYAGAGQLFIKDEGSDQWALYGNKVRKYEYALPNIARAGATAIASYGSLGSNHCTFLTLAARLGRYQGPQQAGGLRVALGLYPQRPTPEILDKLRLMRALGAHLEFLSGDAEVGLAIAGRRLQELLGTDGGTVYVEPGGSSPLTVLGHVDALLELDEQIRAGSSPLDAPPDFIFVPVGSGATSIGLTLGCHLLDWPTRVVATASQEKPAWVRLLVNGTATEPFTAGHARNLLAATLEFLCRLDFENTCGRRLETAAVMHRFTCDNSTWRPAYGVPSAFTRRILADAGHLGLVLDPTFSGKAFSTLVRHGRAGWLKGRRTLFWNTHQRFPFGQLPLVRNLPLDDLPEGLRDLLSSSGNQAGTLAPNASR